MAKSQWMGIKGSPLQNSSSATSIRSRYLQSKMKSLLLVLLACIVGVESLGGSLGCVGYSCYFGHGGYGGYGTYGGYGKIRGYGGYGGHSGGPGWWQGGGYRPWGGLILGGGGYRKFHGKY
ncbi:hypothetical protein CHS0354_002995 [Potamilus streckersoni]|uniref:Uncharacterized protein n=1 Tax=Potamilus streckersoni TaxID=2493646 RepID=A0AAE0VJ63_9BIVA|nr:hypothetical protein CHS0354_002995 [Potamilus streckersoni]